MIKAIQWRRVLRHDQDVSDVCVHVCECECVDREREYSERRRRRTTKTRGLCPTAPLDLFFLFLFCPQQLYTAKTYLGPAFFRFPPFLSTPFSKGITLSFNCSPLLVLRPCGKCSREMGNFTTNITSLTTPFLSFLV